MKKNIKLLTKYHKSVNLCYKEITKKEQIELLKRMKKGDKNAEKEFIISFLVFILYLVKFTGNVDEYMDSVQEGNLMLCELVKNRKIKIDGNFISYIRTSIEGRIKNREKTRKSLIHIPPVTYSTITKYYKVKEELALKLGKNPTYEQIIEKHSPKILNVNKTIASYKRYDRMYSTFFVKSIHDKIDSKDGEKREIKDIIIDKRPLQSEIVNKKLNNKYLKSKIQEVFEKLSNDQIVVIKLYYGLDDNVKKTDKAIAKMLNIECVDTIKTRRQKALSILRKEMTNKINLYDFISD